MPEFKNLSTLDIQFSNNYIFLSAPFDSTRTKGALPLPGNTGYNFNQISAEYLSSNARLPSFTVRAETGQFYTGWKRNQTCLSSSVLMFPELSRQPQECADWKMKTYDLMGGKRFEFFFLFSKLLMKIWSALNDSCYFVCL